MFEALSFRDILAQERVRESNDCHNPPGAGGGQFCAGSGGGGSLTPREQALGRSISAGPDTGNWKSKVTNPTDVAANLRTEIKGYGFPEIADHITSDWGGVSPAATPSVRAMMNLTSSGVSYGADRSASVMRDFLQSSKGWKGPVAKVVKAELTRRLKGK